MLFYSKTDPNFEEVKHKRHLVSEDETNLKKRLKKYMDTIAFIEKILISLVIIIYNYIIIKLYYLL